MKLINNRYRIIKCLRQSRFVTSFIVNDIRNGKSLLQMNIINPEFMPQELLDFYSKQFITLIGLNNESMLEVYNFGLVNTIDNNKLSNNQYYYTTENTSFNKGLMSIVKDLTYGEILDLFVNICNAVNFLHIKGFVYTAVNTENIFADYTENKVSIKLNDLATIELEKYDYWNTHRDEVQFRAPEVLNDSKPDVKSDIYSLGILLLTLCKKSSLEDLNISNELSQLKKLANTNSHLAESDILFLNNISKIISKMIDKNPKHRYADIGSIIDDINQIFRSNYKPFKKEQLTKLNLDTKFVGREFELTHILNIEKLIETNETDKRFVIIHGESGIGKTRLLNELKHMFCFNKVSTYSSFAMDSSSRNSNKALAHILKKIMADCNPEILEKYKDELVKLVPEFGNSKNAMSAQSLWGEKEIYKLVNSIFSFVVEFAKKKTQVFIIDNLHYSDEFTLQLLEYIYIRSLKSRKVLFVFSYNDMEYASNKKFNEFITTITNKPDVIDINLHGLSNEESCEMIRNILSLPNKPVNFASKIYSQAYGNPLFIQETLKNFYAKKIIYVDDNTGEWMSKYNEDYYKELPIPTSMEQAVLNQLRDVDDKSYNILKVISIFNTAVPVEAIKYFLDYDFEEINVLIDVLIFRGILSRKIEDTGFVYDFYNRIMKNIVYNKLDEQFKKINHEKAAVFLEKQYKGIMDNNEELIFHLEMADKKDKIIKYCLKNAAKMEQYKNRPEAVKNLEKAFSMYDKDSLSIEKIELLLRIGGIYEEDGNLTKALENYKAACELSLKTDDTRIYIKSLLKMGNVYSDKSDIEEAKKIISKADALLKNINYTEGLLEVKKLQANIALLEFDYEQAFSICSEHINLCTDEFKVIKGTYYIILGNIYMQTSKINESLEAYENSLQCYQEANDSKGVARVLNNLGVVYGDYLQNNTKAVDFFMKMKDICEQNSLISLDILALTNLAFCYFDNLDYEVSLDYFKNSLDESIRTEYESNVFYCYNYLSSNYLRLDNYKKSLEYYVLAKKEFEKYPNQGRDLGAYYQIIAELFYKIGDYKYAMEMIIKSLEVYSNNDSKLLWDSQILFELISIAGKDSSVSIDDRVRNIKRIIRKYSLPLNKYDVLFNSVIALIEENYINYARELIDEFLPSGEDYSFSKLNAKRLYITALLSNSETRFTLLNKAKDFAKEGKQYSIYTKICEALGDYYIKNKNYFCAVNYYYEACEIVKKLCSQLPPEYKTYFINSHNSLNPFNRLALIESYTNCRKIHDMGYKRYENVDLEQLQTLFEYNEFANILSGKAFKKSAQKIYNSLIPYGIRSVQDIITNLDPDPIKSLELILKYLCGITFASRGLIVLDNEEQGFEVIASSNSNVDISESRHIFERAKLVKECILVSNNLSQKYDEDTYFISSDIKAVICIPVIYEKGLNSAQSERRKISADSNSNVKAYLYLESDKILNNFNDDTENSCKDLIRFIYFIVEKYLLKISSSIDKLTGVITRKALDDALDENLEQAGRLNNTLSIIMFDLDHFKSVNDKFGHQTGDEVLKKVCSIVKNSIRKDDVCGRYGGEEFIVLLPSTGLSKAAEIAERLRASIEAAKVLGDKTPVTISMGIAAYPEHGEWKQELIEKVDQALYIAKESGRNRCQVWSDEFSNKVNVTNKLTGVVSGNAVQDYRNVLVIVEFIKLLNSDTDLVDKIYTYLGRLIEFTEAQYGSIFLVENSRVVKRYSRKAFQEGWLNTDICNNDLLEETIEKKQGFYKIDWDEIRDYDSLTGIPDWHSVIGVPLINKGVVKGVLSLTVSIKQKEFKYDDFNLVSVVSELAAAML